MNPIFRAIIQKGKVIFDQVDMFNSYLIGLEGKEVDVIVRKRKKIRTNPQNSWYWVCVVAIPAEHFGYTSEEMHDAYKFMFLQRNEQGKPLTVKSTTLLSTVEFSEYVEKCRQFCAEEGLYIPDPEEVDYPGKYEKTEEEKNIPVSAETLEELLGWIGKGSVTQENLMKLCSDNFGGREPRELLQSEAEQLDTLIIAKLLNI